VTIPWHVRTFFGIVSVVGIAGVVYQTLFPTPGKTNAQYLHRLLEEQMLRRAATALVKNFQNWIPAGEREQAERRPGGCMTTAAELYLASGDPDLSLPGNRDTPKLLELRFWKECRPDDADRPLGFGHQRQ